MMTPEERALRARIAANTRWAQERDRSAATEPARSARLAAFERQADPEGRLDAAERARRADQLQRAHMQKMTLAAMRTRRKAAEARAEADAAARVLLDPAS